MNRENQKRTPTTGRLRDAFLSQPAAAPGEEWYLNVMRRVRAKAKPDIVPFPWLAHIAWRVAAAAAVLAVVTGVASIVPKTSASTLAWEIATSKTKCEWLLASKE